MLLEKLSKFLIPLSDCPFVLNCLPVFLGKSPCFREKTGKVIYRRHPQYDSHAAAAAFSRVQRNAVPRLSRIGQHSVRLRYGALRQARWRNSFQPKNMKLGIANDSERAGHEQAAQIAVTLFADTAEPFLTCD